MLIENAKVTDINTIQNIIYNALHRLIDYEAFVENGRFEVYKIDDFTFAVHLMCTLFVCDLLATIAGNTCHISISESDRVFMQRFYRKYYPLVTQ